MIIKVSKKTVKMIEHLDVKTKNRLKRAIYNLPNGDIKLLTSRTSTWRLRVGNWRIFFSYPKNNEILIEKIVSRGQAYKG